MYKGTFIVFAGPEGAGKTTQLRLLYERLKQHGHDVVLTREPGGTPKAEVLRQKIKSPEMADASADEMHDLFWEARIDHVQKLILPALRDGNIVLCDRFDEATRSYQIEAQGGHDLEPAFWQMRQEHVVNVGAEPDLYLIFAVSPEEGLRRIREDRGEPLDHFELRDIEFHKRMMLGLKKFAEHVPERCVEIDASQSIDAIHAHIWSTVSEVVKEDKLAGAR